MDAMQFDHVEILIGEEDDRRIVTRFEQMAPRWSREAREPKHGAPDFSWRNGNTSRAFSTSILGGGTVTPLFINI